MYTPDLSAQVMYGTADYAYSPMIQPQFRQLIGHMPDHHQASAFYTFYVGPYLGQCCQHLHFHDLA